MVARGKVRTWVSSARWECGAKPKCLRALQMRAGHAWALRATAARPRLFLVGRHLHHHGLAVFRRCGARQRTRQLRQPPTCQRGAAPHAGAQQQRLRATHRTWGARAPPPARGCAPRRAPWREGVARRASGAHDSAAAPTQQRKRRAHLLGATGAATRAADGGGGSSDMRRFGAGGGPAMEARRCGGTCALASEQSVAAALRSGISALRRRRAARAQLLGASAQRRAPASRRAAAARRPAPRPWPGPRGGWMRAAPAAPVPMAWPAWTCGASWLAAWRAGPGGRRRARTGRCAGSLANGHLCQSARRFPSHAAACPPRRRADRRR